ncbi:hypothetical protein HPP92_024291 [Vanilla planifolia]|uniref:Calcineurin B-like protein n=1 Tax=Vanilla planifolia TaxID=51239 RepID=A0A835PNA3_VANPL|nr:hypothetical protein HPP92_024618 [Vanilla planifolia]KAG0456503.1 hypothetical protein HPP92_024291 [Vanilla planifolia]
MSWRAEIQEEAEGADCKSTGWKLEQTYISSIMGCAFAKQIKQAPGYEHPTILASQTAFTVSQVEALHELYKKICNSINKDGLIHKEEFQLALFKNSKRHNFFADRIFNLFDTKHNGVIEFEEFVKSLSIFHPNTSQDVKIEFAFRLYNLRNTGFIEGEEVKEMVNALLKESNLYLSEEIVDTIVGETFKQADSNCDGKIDPTEWKEFVKKNPSLLKNMTIPYLIDITMEFPSFVMNNEVDDESMS